MADTHINAYFADVEEKRLAAVRANGELEVAEAALAAKKREIGYVESVEEPAEEPTKQSVFSKKK